MGYHLRVNIVSITGPNFAPSTESFLKPERWIARKEVQRLTLNTMKAPANPGIDYIMIAVILLYLITPFLETCSRQTPGWVFMRCPRPMNSCRIAISLDNGKANNNRGRKFYPGPRPGRGICEIIWQKDSKAENTQRAHGSAPILRAFFLVCYCTVHVYHPALPVPYNFGRFNPWRTHFYKFYWIKTPHWANFPTCPSPIKSNLYRAFRFI